MTTIKITGSSCIKNDSKMSFGTGGIGVRARGFSHIVSKDGIFVTKNGVAEAALIPWSEIENLAVNHVPDFK